MSREAPAPRAVMAFNGSRLLLVRLVIVAAALLATIVILKIWPGSFAPNHVYALTDLILSCVAIARLKRSGWVLVGVHVLVSLIWCEIAWNLPARWFA